MSRYPYLLGLICALFFLLSSDQGHARQKEFHRLKESLSLAQPGDFIVVLQGKTYTVLHIHSRANESLIIEEISVPQTRIPSPRFNWRRWAAEGALHHTSWFMYEIHLPTSRILEMYSFNQRGWADIDSEDNLLSTMLSLRLFKLDDDERKRVGPAPIPGQMDRRRVWQPAIVVDGKPIKNIPFNAWRTYWPRDGSDLSGKTIDLYLPSEPTADVPSYFPAWLEVSGTFGKAKLRIVDSGKGLKSPQIALPRRPPAFLDNGRWIKDALVFKVRVRPYFTEYHFYAFDPTNSLARYEQLEYETEKTRNEEEILIKIQKEHLQRRLGSKGQYWFQIAPSAFPELLAETEEPIVIP